MTDSRVDVQEILDKFGLNYMAIQGSTDDVDIIDRDIERLLDQAKSALSKLLIEEVGKIPIDYNYTYKADVKKKIGEMFE